MKTKQEQIKAMANLIHIVIHEKCPLNNGGHCIDCDYNTDEECQNRLVAKELFEAGYGDVSEYKAEIERLRTTLGQCNTELNSALESLKSQCREIGALKAGTKQAKIDVLNRVMTYINDKIENDYGDMSDSVKYLTINIDDFDDFIDELIKEVENE